VVTYSANIHVVQLYVNGCKMVEQVNDTTIAFLDQPWTNKCPFNAGNNQFIVQALDEANNVVAIDGQIPCNDYTCEPLRCQSAVISVRARELFTFEVSQFQSCLGYILLGCSISEIPFQKVTRSVPANSLGNSYRLFRLAPPYQHQRSQKSGASRLE
jgi:hypothetical protein